MSEPDELVTLKAYAEGRAGTRDTIERLGLDDYADLLIALGRYDLPLPKPPDTPALRAHRERAHAILAPLLARE